MQPVTISGAVRQGNTARLRFTFPIGTDLTGATFVFFARWAGGSMRRTDMAVSLADRTVTLMLTAAETRALPPGRATDFELEWRSLNGDQTTVSAGFIDVERGINDD